MAAYKNIAKHPITFNLNGNDPEGVEVVKPGATFTLSAKEDYVVGTLVNPEHVQKLDLDEDDDETDTEAK